MRVVGIVLAVLGGLVMLLGVALVVATNVQYAEIKCPGDMSCTDRWMGRGLFGMFGLGGVVVAVVGGVMILADSRRRARRLR